MVQKSIEQQIWEAAHRHPDKTAVISGKARITYAKLCASILAARQTLQDDYGLKQHDTIIIAAGKQVEFLYAYFGAHLTGIRVVPIDEQTNTDRLQFIVQTIHARRLIGFDHAEIDLPQSSLSEFLSVSTSVTDSQFPDMDSVADVLFTTGTTGVPKGVPLTFANEAAAARNINTFIGNTTDDIEMLALPISHSFGLGRLRCCLSIGATILLLGNFANVKKLYRLMGEEHITGFTMVPASWRYLHNFSGDKLGEFKDQLRYIEMGSAFFSAEEKLQLASLLPNTRVCMHYGLTEASRSAFMEFHDDQHHLDSVGKASPFTDIKILNEQGQECQPDEDGEICIKGEHVTHGYLNIPTEESFFGDYFRTGDWGHLSCEGYLYLASRKKDLINVGGKKVSPEEVELQIMKVQGVKDCACIATPDKEGMLGEVVKAFIVRKEGEDITFDTIRQKISPLLEYYKLPVVWEWINEIPKTQNGKIQRNLLK